MDLFLEEALGMLLCLVLLALFLFEVAGLAADLLGADLLGADLFIECPPPPLEAPCPIR
jgi:hypothetical protein